MKRSSLNHNLAHCCRTSGQFLMSFHATAACNHLQCHKYAAHIFLIMSPFSIRKCEALSLACCCNVVVCSCENLFQQKKIKSYNVQIRFMTIKYLSTQRGVKSWLQNISDINPSPKNLCALLRFQIEGLKQIGRASCRERV